MSFLKVVADFEAYYCSKSRYSLRVMDIPSYILDPRFEEIGCAFKIDGQPTQWVDGPHVGGYLKRLKELSRDVRRPIMFINHNTPFDGSIASWRHGFVADCYVDTLAMSRALLGYKLARNDLDSVARYLKVGSKGTTVHKVNGMRRQDIINAGIYDEYAAYSCLDSDLCWGIFNILFPVMPVSETAITDMVLRMAIEPSLKLEPALLQEHLAQVRAEKDALLAEAGFDMSTEASKQAAIDSLMSNDRFADVLRTLNVSPPKKVSPTTGQVTYAFAKTDDGMKDLLEHPDLAVQAVVGARLGVKSTIEETRTERFLNISSLTFPAYGTNLFPIALKVSGAHTHRLCLVGETIICTLSDNRVVHKRLDELNSNDLVWDGEAFVQHGGLAYAGVKEVITYDTITGTKDHRVRTVEHGYRPLAEAKARSLTIARGSVPDAARIDPSVFRSVYLQTSNSVRLREMQPRSPVHVEGPAQSRPGVVQILRIQGADGRQKTFTGNVGVCCAIQPRGRGSCQCVTQDRASSEGHVFYERDHSVPSKTAFSAVAGARLEACNAHGAGSVSTLHQPKGDQLPFLRRQRDCVRVCIDSSNDALGVVGVGAADAGEVNRSDKHERALHAGQSSLGGQEPADAQPQFMATWDIVDCGPRNCFMANGRIVHNSGDWRLNQQNMSRPSRKRPRAMLRESIVAPDGYTILAGDESQIEARLTALFCGQMDLVQEFAQGGDPYSSFASKIFGFPVSKATPGPRFCGKTCLAPDTKVLTERGWVSITSVTTTDKLWDGVEWVLHDGLIFQGYKSTTKAFGLDATPDHEILTEAGLVEWSLVRTNKSLFQSALSLVNLPSQVTSQCERPSEFRTSKHASDNLRPVFDIVNAGPRHRFTVWTDSGPIIVSNCVLSAGFGVGWRKYQASIKHLSKEQLGTALVLTDDEAQNHIALYRDDKPYIAKMWRYLNDVVIPAMTRIDCDFMLGPVRVMYEKIVLPNGLCLHYRGLHRDAQSGDWLFVYGNRIKKIYGGKLLENIIQALARVIIMDAALRLRPVMATLGAKLVMQVHDELVYLVPIAMIEFAEHYLKQELTRCPVWMPGLPLACETGKDRSYGQAK